MTTEFTNEHHEILFALFVCQSNKAFQFKIADDVGEKDVIYHVAINYLLMWEDRAICEPEFTGYLSDSDRRYLKLGGMFEVYRESDDYFKNKTTFKFEE